MGEFFIMDKRAHFKTENKYFSGLRGFATGVCTKDQARDEIYKGSRRAKGTVKLPVNGLQ